MRDEAPYYNMPNQKKTNKKKTHITLLAETIKKVFSSTTSTFPRNKVQSL